MEQIAQGISRAPYSDDVRKALMIRVLDKSCPDQKEDVDKLLELAVTWMMVINTYHE